MTCTSSARDQAYLQALTCRITWLECALKTWGHILHTIPNHRTRYATVVSVTEDVEGVFTVTWLSERGVAYEVQESADGVVWYIAAARVYGEEIGNLTSWLSPPIPEEQEILYRVVELPRILSDCYCVMPGEEPVRYTDQIVGPTGGHPNGGCSDCAGNFGLCDDELAEFFPELNPLNPPS
jgi:hypothetical protein